MSTNKVRRHIMSILKAEDLKLVALHFKQNIIGHYSSAVVKKSGIASHNLITTMESIENGDCTITEMYVNHRGLTCFTFYIPSRRS